MGIYAEPQPALKGHKDPNECELCGGSTGVNPPKLEGGQIIGESEHAYTYGYFDRGRFTGALIAPWKHMDVFEFMSGPSWAAAGRLYGALRESQPPIGGLLYGLNVSLNDGYVAGQRLWHAHLHVVPRTPGKPSSCVGLKTLVLHFDGLVTGVSELTSGLSGPHPKAQLMGLIHEATRH